MKNKTFILGLLIALFAVSVPLTADPGGVVTSSIEATNIHQIAVTTDNAFTIEAAPAIAIPGLSAIAATLFIPAVRRRILSIPWRTSFGKLLKTANLKVRRSFDKLTVSPVLKMRLSTVA